MGKRFDIEIIQKPFWRDLPGERKMWESVGDSVLRIDDCIYRIKSGFRFDGSSVPRPLRWIVDKTDMGLLAPEWHDKLYRDGGWAWCESVGKWVQFSRLDSDYIYAEIIHLEGGKPWRRRLAHAGLVLGGWTRWKNMDLPPAKYERLNP